MANGHDGGYTAAGESILGIKVRRSKIWQGRVHRDSIGTKSGCADFVLSSPVRLKFLSSHQLGHSPTRLEAKGQREAEDGSGSGSKRLSSVYLHTRAPNMCNTRGETVERDALCAW